MSKKQEKSNAVEVLKKFNEMKAPHGEMILMSNKIASLPSFSSGIASLDIILGGKIGCAYPYGRIIEIYGPESSGKTTTTLHAAVSAQNNGGTVAFIDAEHALDIKYASDLGVNIPALLIQQPDHGEMALEAVKSLANIMKKKDLIIIDSVAALTPKAELEGDFDDTNIGMHAKLMSRSLKVISTAAGKSGVTILFVNQTRNKVMVMMGSNITTTGGNALKFYATQRIEVKSIGKVKGKIEGKETIIGNKTLYKVVKNKAFPPFRQTETEIRFGKGVSKVLDYFNLGRECGIIFNNGSHYYLRNELDVTDNNGLLLGNGINNVIELIEGSPHIMKEIEKKVEEAYR